MYSGDLVLEGGCVMDVPGVSTGHYTDTSAAMVSTVDVIIASYEADGQPAQGNATIGVVATNVILTKEQSFKMAAADQEGIALAVRPAHTMGDGDTMFAIPTGELQGGAHIDRLLAAVVVVTSRAITSGVRKAVGVQGLPAVSDLTEAQHG